MGGLCGKRSLSGSQSNVSEALHKIENEKLIVDTKIKKNTAEAKEHRQAAAKILKKGTDAASKTRAASFLKKAQVCDASTAKLCVLSETLLVQEQAIRDSVITAGVLESMQQGLETVRQMRSNGQLPELDNVDDMISEIQEQREYFEDIDSIIAQTHTFEDEEQLLDEIERQLQSIENEEEETQPLLEDLVLPDVPRAENTKKNKRTIIEEKIS